MILSAIFSIYQRNSDYISGISNLSAKISQSMLDMLEFKIINKKSRPEPTWICLSSNKSQLKNIPHIDRIYPMTLASEGKYSALFFSSIIFAGPTLPFFHRITL
jgi:hypothetical protein